MQAASCSYTTHRLTVGPWHRVGQQLGLDLNTTVSELLTPAVTAHLPPAWAGPFHPEQVTHWLAERDAEGTMLLVVDTSSESAVGFVTLFEDEEDGGELRLGYVLGEATWGRGLASELVAGLIVWLREHTDLEAVIGGVDVDNPASARVLTKNGFQPSEAEGPVEWFRLQLRIDAP